VSKLDIRVLETAFRGYARKSPCSWALHYNIAFACMSDDVPEFLAKELSDVKGFFQLPQHLCSMGLWGQFEKVDVRSDNEIQLGPRRVWHTHGQVTVARDQLYDAWARVKIVYTFRRLPSSAWFKTDVAFRSTYVEDLEQRWGKDYWKTKMRYSSLCYSGNLSSFSVACR
jgi:hypothetical protein